MPRATERQLDYARNIARTLNIDLPKTEDRFVIGAFIAKNKDNAALREKEENRIIYENIKRNVSIVSVAKEMGYEVTRKGRYYSLKEHDSVRIDPDTNRYIRNADPENKGSVIDFVKNFNNMTEREAVEMLKSRITVDGPIYAFSKENDTSQKKQIKRKEKFELPAKGPNRHNVYAYLIQSRYIDQDIVQYFFDRKMIYQDIRKNCVFVSYKDETPVFGCMKGTNTFMPFQADIECSDYGYGWFVNNGAKKLYVAEAPIDIMSRMTMFKRMGVNLEEYDYLALSGSAKIQPVVNHTRANGYDEILVGTDNDEGGRKSLEAIKKSIAEEKINTKITPDRPDITKDWNEELKYLFTKGYRYTDYMEPGVVQLNIMNQQVAALAVGNTAEYQNLQKQLDMKPAVAEELRTYMFDYLEKNYEKAMEDLNSGGSRSIRAILKNYNRQTPFKPKGLKPKLEKGISI